MSTPRPPNKATRSVQHRFFCNTHIAILDLFLAPGGQLATTGIAARRGHSRIAACLGPAEHGVGSDAARARRVVRRDPLGLGRNILLTSHRNKKKIPCDDTYTAVEWYVEMTR